MKEQLERLKALIESEDKHVQAISQKGIHWHVDHSLRAILGMANSAISSNPADYKWQFNKTRAFVFTFNYIPRGRGKAPKVSVNQEQIDIDEMRQLFTKASQAIKELDGLSKKHFYHHHIFGHLNKRRTKKMIRLHTDHHLKIIDDIIKTK